MKPKLNTLFSCESLSLFERLESNFFDLIYVNPPFWNTSGKLGQLNKLEYDDYLFRIIQQSYRCLKETGHLLFFADLNFNIPNLIELVFGRDNFQTQFILPIKSYGNKNSPIGTHHNNLYSYSKSSKAFLNPIIDTVASKELEKRFAQKDHRGKFIPTNLFSSFHGINYNYEWQGHRPPKGMGWRISKDRLEKLFKDDKIYFLGKNSTPTLKRYFSEASMPLIGTIWDDIGIIDSGFNYKNRGTKFLDFSKRIISLTTNKGDNIFVPFTGAGSMIISATQLKRNWIANTNPESSAIIEEHLNESNISFRRQKLPKKIIWNDYNSLFQSEEEVLKAQIKGGEHQGLEFKESLKWNYNTSKAEKKLIENILKEIAGFMNSKYGGKLLIGVRDNGEAIDLLKDFKAANPQKINSDGYALYLADQIRHGLGPNSIKHYKIDFPNIGANQICQIQITPSEEPIFFQGQFVVRNGTQATRYTPQETYQYLRDIKIL